MARACAVGNVTINWGTYLCYPAGTAAFCNLGSPAFHSLKSQSCHDSFQMLDSTKMNSHKSSPWSKSTDTHWINVAFMSATALQYGWLWLWGNCDGGFVESEGFLYTDIMCVVYFLGLFSTYLAIHPSVHRWYLQFLFAFSHEPVSKQNHCTVVMKDSSHV